MQKDENSLMGVDIEPVRAINHIESVAAALPLHHGGRDAANHVDGAAATGGTGTHQRLPKTRSEEPRFPVDIVNLHRVQYSTRTSHERKEPELYSVPTWGNR